jgi:hypothetical protein
LKIAAAVVNTAFTLLALNFATWTVNWRHGSSTTIPISLGFGRVWKFEGPELNTWVSGEWTAYRQYTNITPMYTVRFGVTLLFPHFQL